jgi:ankyrin repeat protein
MYGDGKIKNVWICILQQLPQALWCKMKVNTTFVNLIRQLALQERDTVNNLARKGLIESLIQHDYIDETNFLDICYSNVYAVKRFMIQNNVFNYNGGLQIGCQTGNKEIIDLMVFYGANDWDISNACKSGNIEIVKLVSSKKIFPVLETMETALFEACSNGSTAVIEFVIAMMNSTRRRSWNLGLCGSCYGSHIKIAEHMIEKGASSVDSALYNACIGGHMEMINFLIHKGAQNWNSGLFGACKGGHRKIVDFMIQKGAQNWNSGLFGACEGGHRKIVDYMIQKGANDWTSALSGAFESGNLEIIKYIIEKGGIVNHWHMCIACESYNVESVNLLISHNIADSYNGFIKVCQYGTTKFVEFLISKGATNLEIGLYNACSSNNYNVTKLLLSKCTANINRCLHKACENGNLKMVKLLIEHGADDWDLGLESARDIQKVLIKGYDYRYPQAYLGQHEDIIKLMKQKGATNIIST